MKINAYHRAILKDYADGDFAHLAEREEISKEEVLNLGDTLLTFMLIELSDEEDCDSSDVAVDRMRRAYDELDVALCALETLHDAMLAKMETA